MRTNMVSLRDFPTHNTTRHACERCGASISPRQSQRTNTGYACKRNTACHRAWRREHPAQPVDRPKVCDDCSATGPTSAMTWVQPFVYVCGVCALDYYQW